MLKLSKMERPKRHFTLVEVLLIVAIAAILVAVIAVNVLTISVGP
jgi:Tfp pilus assembly protein FimT